MFDWIGPLSLCLVFVGLSHDVIHPRVGHHVVCRIQNHSPQVPLSLSLEKPRLSFKKKKKEKIDLDFGQLLVDNVRWTPRTYRELGPTATSTTLN